MSQCLILDVTDPFDPAGLRAPGCETVPAENGSPDSRFVHRRIPVVRSSASPVACRERGGVLTLVLKPRGRGNWKTVLMEVKGDHIGSLFLRAGQLISLGDAIFRIHEVRI